VEEGSSRWEKSVLESERSVRLDYYAGEFAYRGRSQSTDEARGDRREEKDKNLKTWKGVLFFGGGVLYLEGILRSHEIRAEEGGVRTGNKMPLEMGGLCWDVYTLRRGMVF